MNVEIRSILLWHIDSFIGFNRINFGSMCMKLCCQSLPCAGEFKNYELSPHQNCVFRQLLTTLVDSSRNLLKYFNIRSALHEMQYAISSCKLTHSESVA